MTILEKAAYLKGLTEGLGLESGSRDAKLWSALNDLLGDIVHKLEEHETALDAQEATLDDVYEQLIYLQEITTPLEELDAEDEDEDDEVYDFSEEDEELYKPSLRLYDGAEDEEDELPEEEPESEGEEADDGEILYDVTCPGCGETITFDEETLELGSIQCPTCGETLEFDLGGEE